MQSLFSNLVKLPAKYEACMRSAVELNFEFVPPMKAEDEAFLSASSVAMKTA